VARPDDLSVHYDAHELVDVVRALELRGGNIGTLTPVIAEDLAERVLENFERSRGHQQGPFPPLAESTIRNRRASESVTMLQDTGLMANIQPFSDDTAAEAFSPAKYVVYHVSRREPRRVIPLRDVFDIDFAAATEYAAEVIAGEFLT
jgi:hypothetical protein